MYKFQREWTKLTVQRRRLDLRKVNGEGERGDEGVDDRRKHRGLFLVSQWSFGLTGTDDDGAGGTFTVVRQRRLGLETDWDRSGGVDGFEEDEKNPNLLPNFVVPQLLPFPLSITCSYSNSSMEEVMEVESRSRGTEVQKARLHPNTIFFFFCKFLSLSPFFWIDSSFFFMGRYII